MKETKSPFLCLVRIHTPQGVQARLFEQTPFIIGREQTADLVIAHSSISRQHLIVNFDEGGVKVKDAGSANGTYLQSKKLTPESELRLQPQDQIKLGLCEEFVEFQIIPRPLELASLETQKSQIQTSLQEVIKGLKNFAYTQVKTELQDEIGQQKEIALKEVIAFKEKNFADADQLKEKLKKDVDLELQKYREQEQHNILQEKADLEKQKHSLQAELKATQEQFEQFNLDAKLSAEKKIQEWLRESQARLQQDEANAFEKQNALQRETQEKIKAELRESQKKADEMLGLARSDAEKTRDTAQQDAQNIRKNALEQSERTLALAEEDGHKLAAEIKARYLAEAESTARTKQQEIIAEFQSKIQEVESKLQTLESVLQEQNDILAKTNETLAKTSFDVVKVEEQLQNKKNQFAQVIQQVENAESIIAKAKEEKKNLESYAIQKIELEESMKTQNEKLTLEYDERRRSIEKELSLLTANHQEGLKKQIQAEELRIREVRKNQASEIARMIEIRMSDRAKAYIQDSSSLSQFSNDLFAAARHVLTTEESSFQPLTLHLNEGKPDLITKNKKYLKPAAITVATAMSLLLMTFKTEVYHYFKSEDQNSVAKQMIEQRKIQSIYNPEQNNEYRETYMDNVLYFKHYSVIKANADYQQKWTLRLNDMALIRELKITEDRMVQFQAIESNMVIKLSEMKASLDAVYLNEGLEAMRKFEMEDVKRLLEILKGQSNYEKIRQIEKEFIQSYHQAHSSEFP